MGDRRQAKALGHGRVPQKGDGERDGRFSSRWPAGELGRAGPDIPSWRLRPFGTPEDGDLVELGPAHSTIQQEDAPMGNTDQGEAAGRDVSGAPRPGPRRADRCPLIATRGGMERTLANGRERPR